jgi:hypothetical protein
LKDLLNLLLGNGDHYVVIGDSDDNSDGDDDYNGDDRDV